VKKELGADDYEAIETNETFSTGRRKYNVTFYAVKDGVRSVISNHLGMRLISKTNTAYMVCQRRAKLPSVAMHLSNESPVEGAARCSSAAAAAALHTPFMRQLQPASITVVPSRPTLSCQGCGAK
jgi:hypothetical protein